MVRLNKTVKILGMALALLMVPLFVGLVCPCAHASIHATLEETVLQTQPCHGCCPEMRSSQGGCEARLEAREAVKTPEFNPPAFSPEAFVYPGSVIATLHAQFAGPPANPLLLSPEPLFVLNQVFRL